MSAVLRRLLAFDVTGGSCSVAVWRDGRVVAARREAMRRGHAERLLPLVEAVMRDAELGYGDLEAVAVTVGPGGFTGVRIGLAAARGLALARGLPVVGVTCFEAVAAAVPAAERRGRTLVVVLDAKRADVYAQTFAEGLTPAGEAMAVRPEHLAERLPPGPLLLAGSAARDVRPTLEAAGRDVALSSALGEVDAERVAALAAGRPRPAADAPPPRPLYLRPPDVTLPAARATDGGGG